MFDRVANGEMELMNFVPVTSRWKLVPMNMWGSHPQKSTYPEEIFVVRRRATDDAEGNDDKPLPRPLPPSPPSPSPSSLIYHDGGGDATTTMADDTEEAMIAQHLTEFLARPEYSIFRNLAGAIDILGIGGHAIVLGTTLPTDGTTSSSVYKIYTSETAGYGFVEWKTLRRIERQLRATSGAASLSAPSSGGATASIPTVVNLFTATVMHVCSSMTSSGTPASTVARFAKFFSTSVTSSPTTCLVLEITPNFAGWQPAAAIPISDLVSIAPSVLRKVITSLHTAIHPAGTIHGDLKMTNILIAPAAAPDVASRAPDVALIDYGLSVPIGTRFANGVPVVIAPTTTSSSSLPSFIVALPSQSCGNAAPEIIMGLLADGILPVAPSNDIWAIGMLVADMAIGLRWTGTPMNAFDSIFAATADGSTNAAIIAAANKDIEEYYETQTGSYIETRHHQRFRSTLGFSTTATSADQHPWDKMFCSSLLKIFCVFGTPDSTTDPTSIYYQNPLFAALPQIPRPTSSRDAFFRAVIFAGDGLLHHRSNYNHTDVFAVAERLYENPTIRSAWDVVMQACQLEPRQRATTAQLLECDYFHL